MTADTIVVLGCTVIDGRPSGALARRIALAARAHREGVAERIIASGGRRWNTHLEAEVIERGLREQGVDAGAILLEPCSLNTRENGIYTARLMKRIGASRAMLATCSWHLPRATRCFTRHGIDVIVPPTAWDETPPATIATRLRERFWRLFS